MKEENKSPPRSHTRASWTAIADAYRAHHDKFGNKVWYDRESGNLVSTRRTPRIPRKDRPRCGARTRKNTHCLAMPIWDDVHDRPRNGRCRNHGGLSTGPRTAEGIARAAAARIRGLATIRARAKNPPRAPKLVTCAACQHFKFFEYHGCTLAENPSRHWRPGTTEFYSPDEFHHCRDYRAARGDRITTVFNTQCL